MTEQEAQRKAKQLIMCFGLPGVLAPEDATEEQFEKDRSPYPELTIGDCLDLMMRMWRLTQTNLLSDPSKLSGEKVTVDGVEYTDADRAGGGCVCSTCGKLYYDHPMFRGILSHGGDPFLNLLCGNVLVKL